MVAKVINEPTRSDKHEALSVVASEVDVGLEVVGLVDGARVVTVVVSSGSHSIAICVKAAKSCLTFSAFCFSMLSAALLSKTAARADGMF